MTQIISHTHGATKFDLNAKRNNNKKLVTQAFHGAAADVAATDDAATATDDNLPSSGI